ncbi:MRC1-like domain-containing protein [Aspergillus egyptiacus]|nr:MRC1-like domain-containing protein [Aspergillus egyptiacus]
MSSPSTPRTTRSASAAADSPEILTPGRKIKAMLAAFDSDSDADNDGPETRKPNANLTNPLKAHPKATRALTMDSDNEEEDDDTIMPRGRIAARLQGDTTQEPSHENKATETAFERVSKALQMTTQNADGTRRDSANETNSSDDELPAAGPRRRIKNATLTRNEDNESVRSRSRAHSFSPLFMSSPTQERDDESEQEQDEGTGAVNEGTVPKRNNRFLELVAKKRKERVEKERIEAEKKAAKAKEQEISATNAFSEDESADDGTSGRKKPAQQSRPARKAGKKALEEMNRETQRMSRNMQLAHEARTKKKITKESFFARFNFMQPQQQTAPERNGENSSTTADSQHSSDAEAQKDKDTPQTSPVAAPTDIPDDSSKELPNFPTLEQLMSEPEEAQKQFEKEIGAPKVHTDTEPSSVKKGKMPIRVAPVRVRLSREQVARHQKDDSDSELEIVTSPAKCRRIAAFENLPARHVQEPSSMFKLKALAQLTSPKRSSTMNSAELSASLLYQAKQQAAQERKERIEELRARGIVIETAAERAAFEDEIENLVEKARQEGEEIAKKEREAAKRKNGGYQDDDDDDDGDFEYSGSEEEDEDGAAPEDEVEMEEDAEADKEGNLFDSEADEDEDEDGEESEVGEEDQEAEHSAAEIEVPTQRRKRPPRVISDDEDEEELAPKTPVKPINPFLNSVERPNIPVNPSEETMSLTQAFAGTLAPSQDMSQPDEATIPQSLPEPVPLSVRGELDSETVIKDSQEQRAGSTDPFGGYWQLDARVSESPAPGSVSQMSQYPDPTQDAGFVLSPFDPTKRFLSTPTPASTIDTVLVDQNQSPVAPKGLRNLRRGKMSELSGIQEQEEDGFEIDASAFDVMEKAAKKVKKHAEVFDRNKSKAKDVVEDAAEESDDEYAGLGGASDDDPDDEENADDREMINDNSGEKVDAKQLAALNALHQRNADEKEVAKLMKDITTGALRRRRGADDELDLDDSDDELLARRRQKQREFARMRNALLADEKVGEIAENPKKAAFFRAIEDRDDDDAGLDFLGYEQDSNTQDGSSSQNVNTEAQPDPMSESNKRKRPLEPAAEDVNNRPPPYLRRKPASVMSKKPATLAEIREAVSFLTERPEYDSFHEDASVDEDQDQGEQHADEDETEEPMITGRSREASAAPSHPRRTRGPVVDRLALLRQASSNSATSASSNTRLAFHTAAGSDKATSFGFRPPILRKSVTASSSSSTSSTSDSSRVTKAPGAGLAKKGAVNYYTAARERERERQLRTQQRNRGSNITALVKKHASNRLGALGGTGNWD